MSDVFLRLIAGEPDFIPTMMSLETLEQMLHRIFPNADEITVSITDTTKFVDPGSNFEEVCCPYCGVNLISWWGEEMDKAFEGDFRDLSIITPCCDRSSSLNDLHYHWTAGFSRCKIEIRNPSGDLDENQMNGLIEVMGCDIRKIWAHY